MKIVRKIPILLVLALVWITSACSPAVSPIENGSQTGTPSYRNLEVVSTAAIASAMLAPTGTATEIASATPSPTESPADQVVFTVQNDLPYRGRAGVPRPDWVGWGAQVFRYQSGDFWLVDSAARPTRLLRFSPPYSTPEIIPIDEAIVSVMDFAIDGDHLWLLDIAALPARVFKTTLDGKVLESYELPKEVEPGGVTGLDLTPDGVPLLKWESGGSSIRLYEQDGKGGPIHVTGQNYGGKLYRVERGPYISSYTVHAGEVVVQVKVKKEFGGVRVIGADSNGDFYIEVTEVDSRPAVSVNREIRRYNAAGEQTGIAYPLPPAIHALRDLAVDPDGGVYQLVSNVDHSEQVVRLGFHPEALPRPSPVPTLTPTPLTPLLPALTKVPADSPDIEQARQTLLSFFTLLHEGHYQEAAPLYEGAYDMFWNNFPSVPKDDNVQLWQKYCTQLTYCPLVARIVEQKQVGPDEYEFVLEFIWMDGTRLVTGPCCSANQAEVPFVWQFPYTVKKIDGKFKVMDGPKYLG